jgi:hypothetical protein
MGMCMCGFVTVRVDVMCGNCTCVTILVMCNMYLLDYPGWGFSVLFPQLYGKCQGYSLKDGARSALFQVSCYSVCSVVTCSAVMGILYYSMYIFILFYYFILFYVYFYIILLFYIILCIVCVYMCTNHCHRVFTQLQLTNISITCFGHHYAHHQELESIIQVVAACRIWCFVFKLSV